MATLIGIAQASPMRVSRGQFFSRGAKGGAAVLLAGSFAESLVDLAAAADPVPDSDLAYARLLVAAEFLALDFTPGRLCRSGFAVMPWQP
jgi:hypothetical protein